MKEVNNKLPSKILNQLQSWFGVGFKSNSKEPDKQIFPVAKGRPHSDKGEGGTELKKIPFDDNVQELFKYFLNNNRVILENYENRTKLFQDMDKMFMNSPIVNKAITLTVDECIQADSNDQVVFIEAKRQLKKDIQEFFDKIDLKDLIRPTFLDIVQYGNAGWVLGFDDEGISEAIPVDVYDIKDRMEFTPFEVERELKKSSSNFRKYSGYDRVKELIDSILEKNNNTSYFKKYLFGFEIGDTIIPPWKFLHFRNMTNKSPFKPFGIPAFIHSMSPYMQYDASMSLQQTARGLRFPKGIFKINIPSAVDPVTKMNKAIEFMNLLTNSGFGTSKKELQGLGDIIVTIQDLYEYTQEENNIDLGKIDDIQMLKDDIILSTFLPRKWLDPNDSGFGDSGVSLIEQFKPFARFVYGFQSIFLQCLTQLVKLHFIYSGKYKPEEIDFTLSMKYPESQTNSDIISSQNSLMDLANSVIDNIQDKILGGGDLPTDIKRSIYTHFLPWDSTTVENWIDKSIKEKEKAEKEAEEGNAEGFGGESAESGDETFNNSEIDKTDSENSEKLGSDDDVESKLSGFDSVFESRKRSLKNYYLLEKSLGKENLKEAINNVLLEKKQEELREYSMGCRHYYSSRNKFSDFDPEMLLTFDKHKAKKLKEGKEENEEIIEPQDIDFFGEYVMDLEDDTNE